MSTRTIIEINHDYVHRLANDPDALVAFFRSFSFLNNKGLSKQAPKGIRVLAERHHSETITLTVD